MIQPLCPTCVPYLCPTGAQAIASSVGSPLWKNAKMNQPPLKTDPKLSKFDPFVPQNEGTTSQN